ncbi:hypothetical protein FDECE_18004, partial [Fusarium decemcellulare]
MEPLARTMAGCVDDDPAQNQAVAQTTSEFRGLRVSGQNKSNPLDGTCYYTFKSKDNADRWFQHFRNFCRPIEGHTGRRSGHIRVAVLDTGLDRSMLTPESCEGIKDVKSFLPGQDVGEHDDLDENRHGTHVVGILLNLAPWAHVYVACIKKGENSPMDPRCIAKAIRYSVETWDVHIISMSWGFKNEHSCISDAIRLAHAKDKIMFAAASNEGANLPASLGTTFPASMREVICVNSSDGYGNKSDFNPPARNGDFNFSTLGEAVPASSSPSELKRQTGSSFATPIAATIAASLLEFIMQKQVLRADTDLKQQAATKDGVTKLLYAIGNPVSGFRYLKPWDLIQCQGLTNSCPCKDCRKAAENKVRAVLEGPLPSSQDPSPFPHLPDSLPDAGFDASNKQHTSFCLPNTRIDILAQIHKWVDGGDMRQVYWLKGMAGTGKTTIALTVARD